MLTVIMFMGFHDPDAGDANLVEGAVMSAAAKAVQTVDEHYI